MAAVPVCAASRLTLPPHPWDDDDHRAAIHRAFEGWSRAHDQGAGHQAGQFLRRLKRLCAEAAARQRTVEVNRALGQLRELEPGEFVGV